MSELLFTNKSDLVAIADKIREKAGISDSLSFPQGFMDSIDGISVGGNLPTDTLDGLSNGYDVMFYDENNEGLAFYSIKQGHTINPPEYRVKNWQTEDGTVVTFPYTPNTDLIVYANNKTYADQLYKHFGVDKGVYPYVFLSAEKYTTTRTRCQIAFGTGLYSGDTGVNGSVKSKTQIFDFAIENVVDPQYLVNVAMTEWGASSLVGKSGADISLTTKFIYATNYPISETSISSLYAYYRLDQ